MKYTTTFWIKDKRRTKSAIICYVHGGSERWRFPVGHSIHPGHWSLAKQRVRAGNPLAAIVNDRLDRIAFDLATIIDTLQATGTINMEAIRERWQATKIVPVTPLDFIGEYEQWIAGQPFTPGTRLNHGKAKNHIKKFASVRDFVPTFEAWNAIAWRAFASYLQSVVGLTNDSVWNVLKSLKSFLASTHERGLHTNGAFKMISKARMVPKGETNTDMAYLTESELSAVSGLDLSDTPRLERVRDLFMFMSLSGIRFGDSQTIGPDHLHHGDDGPELKFVTGKNRKAVTVPLLPEAARIWQMYEGTLPRITNQKANTYLAEVLKIAGIDSPVNSVRFRGVERIETTEPKYNAIGMHGAKRTFVTLAILRGVSLETLARITGNSVSTLRIYDVRTAQEAGKLFREASE